MPGARHRPSIALTGAVGPDDGAVRSHHTPLWLRDLCGSRSNRPVRTPTPLQPSRSARNANNSSAVVRTWHSVVFPSAPHRRADPGRTPHTSRLGGCTTDTTFHHRPAGVPGGPGCRIRCSAPTGSGPCCGIRCTPRHRRRCASSHRVGDRTEHRSRLVHDWRTAHRPDDRRDVDSNSRCARSEHTVAG